jgi:C_GCAxxG_C_C family probable redox protein
MKSDDGVTCRERCEALFNDGFYCAECVVQAVADHYDLESELLPRLATGFCSGMARTGGTCGAVTGGVLALSLFLGRATTEQPVEANYALVQTFVDGFKQEFGTLNCSDLLGCDLGNDAGRQQFQDQDLQQRCRGYSSYAAEMVSRLLDHGVQADTESVSGGA